MAQHESSRPANRARHRHGGETSKRNQHRKKKTHTRRRVTSADEGGGEASSQGLSAGALAQLNREHERQKPRTEGRKRTQRQEAVPEPDTPPPKTRKHHHAPQQRGRGNKRGKKKRVVSGAMMEEGRVGRSGLRGGGGWSEDSLEKEDLYQRRRKKKSRKKLWILLGCSVVVLIIVIVVGVVVSRKSSGDSGPGSSLEGKDRAKIPAKWQNTYLDPWAWQTTSDFNVTFTDDMVGGLPVMGLFAEWDDSSRANDKVPALKDKWGSYGDRPARGVNLGGWLTLEPFITPSLFDYSSKLGIVDEYSLCRHLGQSAAKTIEAHYDSFVTEDTFRAIAAAGLDHVRIPFSHWAVDVYGDDPYVFRTSWRYLLRGIEWARKHGLRVNLDLHSLPGSQNGWNHSGRSGPIGWLNGTEGQANARRSLEVHDRLSKFFAQDRYRNIVTHYGLVNEPRMTFLRVADVVSWTNEAYKLVRRNGVAALVVFGDGFMGLDKWQGLLDDMVLDVHQYLIFNENQIDLSHRKKVQYACEGWTQQTELSMDPARGHGPTVFAEWSQADTDCARHLTGVGWGNRWEGTFDTGDSATSTLEPRCPAKDASCSCAKANQDPGQFSPAYAKFLRMFAEAQMHSFEKGWGWWYWTWKTESAPLWSYEAGLRAGILPAKAYEPAFKCDADVPDFAKDGLPETY